MSWSNPITDRTLDDVLYALENQNLVEDLKGAFNISDANRIIDNTLYLKELLESYEFPVLDYEPQEHIVETDIPYISSVIWLMIQNVIVVTNAYYITTHQTLSYPNNLNYQKVNDIEENLRLTYKLLTDMISNAKKCGTFISGQTVIL